MKTYFYYWIIIPNIASPPAIPALITAENGDILETQDGKQLETE